MITTDAFVDAEGISAGTYRLTAVNGLGAEVELGRARPAPITSLAAWPLPFRGGELHVSYAAVGAVGDLSGGTSVGLYDVAGRLVRQLAIGGFPAGHHTVTWDGRGETDRRVPSGVYVLRLETGGATRQLKVVVAR